MLQQPKSRSELTQHVACLVPSRSREDDRIVELFLHAFRQGRFSDNPRWLPQHVKNVDVIATDKDRRRLAIEHTRILSFEEQPKQEIILRPIAEHLLDVRKSMPSSAKTQCSSIL